MKDFKDVWEYWVIVTVLVVGYYGFLGPVMVSAKDDSVATAGLLLFVLVPVICVYIIYNGVVDND